MIGEIRPEQLRYRLLPYIEKAYVLESLALKMMEHHASRFVNYPDVHAKFSHFEEETEHHRAHLEQLLRLYNEQPPDTSGKPPFSFLRNTPIATLEEVLPNIVTLDMFDEYCYTHFLVAMYTLLDTMARVFDDERTILVVEEMLLDKLEMQRWMLENLPEITLRSLGQDGVSVPQSAWEFARKPEMVGFVSTIASFTA